MASKTKHLLRPSAVQNVKKMFAGTTGDSVTLDEACKAWDRDLSQREKNRAWLSNKLTDLKYYNLVDTAYSYDGGPKRLERIILTSEGRRELERINDGPQVSSMSQVINSGSKTPVTVESALEIIKELKEAYKDTYDINFDIKLKGT